jgi:hypothetical protein
VRVVGLPRRRSGSNSIASASRKPSAGSRVSIRLALSRLKPGGYVVQWMPSERTLWLKTKCHETGVFVITGFQ